MNSIGLENMETQVRKNIKPGMPVAIVLKQDQQSGKLTKGVVKTILTNSTIHPHGIKVMLEDGQVGRVKNGQVGRVKIIIRTTENQLDFAI